MLSREELTISVKDEIFLTTFTKDVIMCSVGLVEASGNALSYQRHFSERDLPLSG